MKPKQETQKEEAPLHPKISIPRPDDWHVHWREGDVLPLTIAASERCFGRCVVMPNLLRPLTTASSVANYGKEIAKHLSANSKLQPLLTMYLTDETTTEEIMAATNIANFFAVKWYPQGVTTNSANGVTDITNCFAVLDKMQELDIPLLVHGESSNPQDDVFEREGIFIETTLTKVRANFPELRITMEHISSKEAVAYLKEAGDKTAATITPQHLWYNRNDMLGETIKPHLYCKPILKREEDRAALNSLAIDNFPRAFLGSDSAPHTKENKESSCGCAGVFSAPFLMEIITQIFDELGALDNLADFTSVNGANFYHFPVAQDKITIQMQENPVPQTISTQVGADTSSPQNSVGSASFVPMAASETLKWRVIDVDD